MFIGILVVLGLVGLSRMPWELFPKIDVPVVTVVVPYPGAGPEEIEQRILKPLEDECSVIQNVDTVSGYAQQNFATVVLDFAFGTDIDVAAADVRDAVSRVKSSFPSGAKDPSVMKLDLSARPVITIGVTGKRPPHELYELVDETIKPRLGSVNGVATVSLTGGQQRELQVVAHKQRLEAVGLSITELANALAVQNLNMPAGSIREGLRDYRVRLLGELRSPDELRNLKVKTRSGDTVRIAQVADVLDTVVEPTQYARIDGNDSIAVGVLKQTNANTVDVCRGVLEQLEELRRTLPADIEFTIAEDESEGVIEAVVDLRNAIVYGAMFAALTIFLFLHNFRGTLIVALAIPTSLIATFLPIGLGLQFTLQMMVMVGLSLSVGVLVDDSVVVLENIERHLHRGELPAQAALNGRSEIGAAAVAITMVDVVVFLPIALMGGLGGQVFFSFAITVVVCVLFSLLMSFTLTPMLASWWYARRHRAEAAPTGLAAIFDRFFRAWDRGFERAQSVYRGILRGAIAHPYLTLFIAYSILLVVLGLIFPTLGMEFFPQSDSGVVGITVKTPVGTRLEETDRVVRIIERRLQDRQRYPEIEHVFATSGTAGVSIAGRGNTGPRWGSVNVTMTRAMIRKRSGQRTANELALALRRDLADLPGVDLEIAAAGRGGPSGADIEFQVYSDDPAQLEVNALKIRDTLQREVPGLYHCSVSSEPGQPEIQVRLDRERAHDFGITLAEVATALRNSIEGNTDSKFRMAGNEYDIRVQLDEQARASVQSVGDIFVRAGSGGYPVRVRDVAEVTLGSGPSMIQHYQRRRTVTITAYSTVLAAGDAQNAVAAVLKKMDLPGTDWEWGFRAQMQRELMGNMIRSILLAVVLVYMVAAALYNSVLEPLNILGVLPLALVGGVIGLALAGMSMSIIAMVGFIMLMGLVGKNSILVVDFTNTLRARGLTRTEALLEAGPTRMKPILMTTFAASMGMLPTALALSEGSEWRAPMAVVVIFGLIISTAVSLLVVPASYCIWDQVGSFFYDLGRRLFVRRAAAAQTQLEE